MGGQTIARIKSSGETSYLHADHLGTPVAATDASGNLLWRETFTPFGESLNPPAANTDQDGFTGHLRDTDTGLTYMQARYYDPVVGRFLSNDPVGFAEGGVDYFNRYAYTANDPVNMIDPDGRQACKGVDGVCLEASNFDRSKSSGATIIASDVALNAVKDNINEFQLKDDAEAKRTNEKLSIVTNDGTIVPANAPSTTQDTHKTKANGKFDLSNANAAAHGHTVSIVPGDEDDLTLVENGLANIAVEENNIGVTEMVDGQFRFRLVQGGLRSRDRGTRTRSERSQIRQRLKDFQERSQGD